MSKRRVYRVLCGGSYYSDSWILRTTVRRRNEPVYRSWDLGFRLVVIGRSP